MAENKREVVFDMPSTYGKYRVVCRIGYSYSISYAWWGHIQKQVEYKRFLFFGKKKQKWVEVDDGWWSTTFNSLDDLKKAAEKFYYDSVELLPSIKNKLLNLK